MELLENPIQRYAWGSQTSLAELLGRAPSGGPEAELWLGAHPAGPSRIADGRTLEALISADPRKTLGEKTATAFGHLPFLLKVLAAEQPLSLQAHPNAQQAKEGFAREEAAGIPRTAPTRLYRDASPKPELICALTGFDALCGFRRVADSLTLLEALQVEELAGHLQLLRSAPASTALAAFFARVMTLEAQKRTRLVRQVVEACAARPPPSYAQECAWAVKLGAAYPGDPGVIGALLLNLVHLKPQQALYLPAGNLHSYLHGTAIELQASSDNVLRGGLTPKHVDVAELMRVLSFDDSAPRLLWPHGSPEGTYDTPTPEFRLSRLSLERAFTVNPSGPEIWLCTEGSATAGKLELSRGRSVFVSASDEPIELVGRAVIWRATVGA